MHFINFKKNSITYKTCCDKNVGFENYILTSTEESLSELFDLSDVVYLSPDSENVIEALKPSKVYVIGGLVDDSVKKNTSACISNSLGIQTARLPISEYMIKGESGTYKQILTINQVFDILLKFQETSCWRTALSLNVPPRTGFKLNDVQ